MPGQVRGFGPSVGHLHLKGAKNAEKYPFFRGTEVAITIPDREAEDTRMPNRKRHTRVAQLHKDHHRQMLLAVLYLCGVVLLINAWLVSQQLISF